MRHRNHYDRAGYARLQRARLPAIAPTLAPDGLFYTGDVPKDCGHVAVRCGCDLLRRDKTKAAPPAPEPPKPAGLYKPGDVVCLHSDSPEDAWDGKVTTVERMKGECIVVKGGGCYHTDFVELVRRAGEPAVDRAACIAGLKVGDKVRLKDRAHEFFISDKPGTVCVVEYIGPMSMAGAVCRVRSLSGWECMWQVRACDIEPVPAALAGER